jgi:hypothetical protein
LCLCFSRFFQDDTVAEVEPKAEAPPESALVEGMKKGGIEMLLSLLSVAPAILAQWAIWLMLILFLLIYAPGFYDSFINLFPLIRDKRRAATCKRPFRYQYVGIAICNTHRSWATHASHSADTDSLAAGLGLAVGACRRFDRSAFAGGNKACCLPLEATGLSGGPDRDRGLNRNPVLQRYFFAKAAVM